MYYKLYRRRYYIYTGLAILLLIFLFYKNQESKANYEKYKQYVENSNNDNNNRRKGARININTYQTPPPCDGCPGENGKAVYLTVSFISRFLIIVLITKFKSVNFIERRRSWH